MSYRSVIGLEFVIYSGYLQVADLNNIVVLFPQVGRSFGNPNNPWGCWDYYGYDSEGYIYRELRLEGQNSGNLIFQ